MRQILFSRSCTKSLNGLTVSFVFILLASLATQTSAQFDIIIRSAKTSPLQKRGSSQKVAERRRPSESAVARTAPKANPYLHKAKEFADLGDYDLAIAQYDQALKVSPSNADIFNLRGLAYLELEKYDQAIADFNKALALNPSDSEFWGNRGDAYAEKDDYQQALKDYKRGLALKSGSVVNLRGLAYAYRKTGDIERALSSYNQVLNIDQKDNEARLGHIICEFSSLLPSFIALLNSGQKAVDASLLKKNLDETERKYSTILAGMNRLIISVENAPNEHETLLKAVFFRSFLQLFGASMEVVSRAHLENKLNVLDSDDALVAGWFKESARFKALIKDCDTIIEKSDPRWLKTASSKIKISKKQIERIHSWGYIFRGKMYELVEERESALNDLASAIEAAPEDSSLWLERGKLLVTYDDKEWAEKDFSKAIELDASEIEAYIERGKLYSKQEKYDKAKEDFSKAISLDAKNVDALSARADFWYEQDEYEKAAKDWGLLASQAPDDPETAKWLHKIGLCHKDLKESDSQLISDFSKAIKLDPTYAWAWHERGLIYHARGDYQLAIQDFSQVIKNRKAPAPLYLLEAEYFRADAYFEVGKCEDSARDLDSYLKDDALGLFFKKNKQQAGELREKVRKCLNKYSVTSINGKWQFTWEAASNGREARIAILDIYNGQGTFTAPTHELVEQQLSVSSQSGKIIAQGISPTIIDNDRKAIARAPGFSPDTITLFAQSDGSYKLYLSDGVHFKELTPITVKKYTPQTSGTGQSIRFAASWVLEWQNREAFLQINGNSGVFRSITTYDTVQQISAKETNDGILVSSHSLFIKDTNVRPPRYSPDELLFRPTGLNSFEVFTRDGDTVKEWRAVPVTSSPLQNRRPR